VEPVEQLVEWCEAHLAWLRSMADAWSAAEMPKVARACDASADQLEQRLAAAKGYLALGDTAVLSIGDYAEPKP
jgi:hypothetical protein